MVVNGGFNVYLLNGEVKIYTTVWYKYLYFIIRSAKTYSFVNSRASCFKCSTIRVPLSYLSVSITVNLSAASLSQR